MSGAYLLRITLVSTSPDAAKGVINWMQAWGKSPMITAGIGTIMHRLRVDDNNVNLLILTFNKDWSNKKNRNQHYSKSSALIIAFDKGDRTSFNAITDLIQCLPPSEVFSSGKIPIAVVGFFSELEQITTMEGKNFAETMEVEYYETDPTDKEVIEQIIHNLTLIIIRQKRDKDDED